MLRSIAQCIACIIIRLVYSEEGITASQCTKVRKCRKSLLLTCLHILLSIQVLSSLAYSNNHSTNRVTDGTRTITISANDTGSLPSNDVRVVIHVGDRNDAPAVNLGAGEGMNLNITFVENGASIPIVLPHLVSIMDEENHNISRLTAELVATNGQLDASDAIFLRSPRALQFIDDFRIPPTMTLIDIYLNATTATFTDALLSIYYDNAEAEPTLYVNNTLLIREVIITVYDNNFFQADQSNDQNSNFDDDFGVSRTMLRVRVSIEPINDNRPRIVIRAEPDGCGVSSVAESTGDPSVGAARRRRDVRAAAARMKRAVRSDSSKVRMMHHTNASYPHFQALSPVIRFFTVKIAWPLANKILSRMANLNITPTPPIFWERTNWVSITRLYNYDLCIKTRVIDASSKLITTMAALKLNFVLQLAPTFL